MGVGAEGALVAERVLVTEIFLNVRIVGYHEEWVSYVAFSARLIVAVSS